MRHDLRPNFVAATKQQQFKAVAVQQEMKRLSKLLEVLHHAILNVTLAMPGIVTPISVTSAAGRQIAKIQLRFLDQIFFLQGKDAGFLAVSQGNADFG